MARRHGWATIIVDSHRPRGFGDYELWRLICTGQLFMGSERAGDLLVAIEDARAMPFVDQDRLVLIGSSHGGWSIMELFALDPPARLPFNLTSLPAGFAERGFTGIVGSILIYPWCGLANRARAHGWRHDAPALFLLSADDTFAPAEDCIEIARTLETNGIPVDTVVFEGVTHGFDQEIRAPFSALSFDAAATAEALRIGGAFLDKVAAEPRPGARPP
jgi:dienelactone hydrolase